jgi:hypothetical protein
MTDDMDDEDLDIPPTWWLTHAKIKGLLAKMVHHNNKRSVAILQHSQLVSIGRASMRPQQYRPERSVSLLLLYTMHQMRTSKRNLK